MCSIVNKDEGMEKILWSVALPGFGQLLNGHLVKGILLIGLEFLINMNAKLNLAIASSFQGNTKLAVEQTDFQWLMFYPCIYMFAIWDAYKYSADEKPKYAFLPFVFGAYSGTIGVIYSSIKIKGILLGPVWLPIFCIMIGVGLGLILRIYLKNSTEGSNE